MALNANLVSMVNGMGLVKSAITCDFVKHDHITYLCHNFLLEIAQSQWEGHIFERGNYSWSNVLQWFVIYRIKRFLCMKPSIIVNYICDPNQETPTPSVKNKGLAATSLYLYTTANAIKVTFTHIFCTNKSSSKALFFWQIWRDLWFPNWPEM